MVRLHASRRPVPQSRKPKPRPPQSQEQDDQAKESVRIIKPPKPPKGSIPYLEDPPTVSIRYLDNAPPALVKIHKEYKITRGRPLLEKLLCYRSDRRMERAWNSIHKSVKSDKGFWKLWMNIVSAKLHASRGIVSMAERRERYNNIAKTAENLAKMIAEPQQLQPDGTAHLYPGDLDLPAYELLKEDVARNLGARSYAKMDRNQRNDWANSLLPEWPTMVELLEELAIRARQLARERVSLAERDRGRGKTAIFIREVYNFFVSLNPRFTAFAAISAITSIAMDIKITSKTVRTVIFGSSGTKLPIKRRRKLSPNEY